MKSSSVLAMLIALVFQYGVSYCQNSSFVLPDQIAISFSIDVSNSSGDYLYDYVVYNGSAAQQAIWTLDLHAPLSLNVKEVRAPNNWGAVVLRDSETTIRWVADAQDSVNGFKDSIQAGSSREGFSVLSPGIPGIIVYYSEGSASLPSFDEGMATDDIPGYYDHTPYGPGVVGKVVGPITPPAEFSSASWIDTLISYKHQSVALGWLRDDKTRKRDCDEMMKGRDWYRKGEFGKFRSWEPDESWDFDHDWNNGIVGVLDRRLGKAKRELAGGDSVGARRDLEIFVMEVEMLNNLSKKSEGRDQKREVRYQKPVMTSEAYALLKYNAEYLIDRLPEGHGKRGERRGKK